jgi:RNA polymerase sigma factor (TIGR02999 family)
MPRHDQRARQALDGEPPVVETEAQDSDAPVVGLPYLGGLHPTATSQTLIGLEEGPKAVVISRCRRQSPEHAPALESFAVPDLLSVGRQWDLREGQVPDPQRSPLPRRCSEVCSDRRDRQLGQAILQRTADSSPGLQPRSSSRTMTWTAAMEEDAAPALTQILARIGRGDELATERLLPLVYAELRALAGSYFRGAGAVHTLQPTALVHEAFIKLTGHVDGPWESRAHFLAVAAKAMRQVLANHAAKRRALKRGGGASRVTLTGVLTPSEDEARIDLIDLDAALSKLDELSPRQARIVEMRFLTGLGVDEIAHVLGISARTVERDWCMARAFLECELEGDGVT